MERQSGGLVEEARLVHPALGHQEMEVRMDIDPVPKCLNGRDDSGHQLATGQNLEIPGQGPEGTAIKIFRKPAIVLKKDAWHLRDEHSLSALLMHL